MSIRSSVLVVLALFSGGPAWSAGAPPTVAPFKFAWPVPSRVGITERVVSERETVTLKYDAVLTARKAGSGFELHFEHLQQVEPDARKGTPDSKSLVATFTKPTLVLSSTGALTELDGLDLALGRAVTVLEPTPEARESLRSRWDTPLFQTLLRDRAEDTWNAWVRTWSGVELAPGQERTQTVRIRHPNGPLEQRFTLRNRGAVAGTPGVVRLEWETALDGAPYRQVIARSRELRCNTALVRNPSDPCAAEVLESASSVTTVELLTEPDTLRPLSVRTERTEAFTVKGQPPVLQREARSFDFEWPRKAKRTTSR
ncbi:hypothetical protein [Corallococcus llansteffanensis]|uniref:DUF2381 family protein n=1 Tax=Corallococcus llansteffanensis TaxID=2316731 RepID=A0A3A8QG91_9BACT|nr:hypothetical protein [Corallococcus llansteffanensis]RKH62234.1 hypothetical protein D7V93_10445 [Corallococcus llansteffanensis]